MTGQLLPLRLLTSSKLLCPYRGAFTFHIKTPTLSSTSSLSASPNRNLAVRCFSTRPARSREDIRTGFRAGGPAGGGQGKSLIEDEAELSDWVGDLSKSSFRLGLSGSDDEESDRDRKGSGSRNGRESRVGVRDSAGFSDKRKPGSSVGFSERNSSGSLSRKQTDRDLGERGDWNNSRGLSGLRTNRSSVGYSERNSRGSRLKRQFGSELEDEDDDKEHEDDDFLSKQKRGRGSSFSSERRGGKSVESGYQRGRKPLSETSEEEDDVDDEDNFLSRQKGGIGSSLSSQRRKGKGVESGYQRGRKPLLEISEDEDEEDEDDAFGFNDVDLYGDKVEGKKVGTEDSLLKSDSGEDSGKPISRSSSGDRDSYLSDTRFDQCSISSLSLKGVKAAGYERMTLVQEATLPIILKGKDVLAKAKTGTGKTVAFLLPAIEFVSKLPPVDRDQKKPPINVLVICPTRELADQAATEANSLLKFHPSIGVQVVIGGTRLALEQKRMQANPCQILVATPGRLRDHIENTPGFATRLMGVKILVLDEADRLLDMGFRKDIEKIVAAVPKQRQTLLFSATVPDEVRQICYIAMKRDHEFVNTVGEGTEETHSQVKQMHLVAPLEKQFPLLYAILKDHIAEDVDYKVIVFCTTAMVTKLVADLLSELRLNVREIHSRKPQSYRTRVSKEFKESKGLILVSSDVSARGVDYPDVTLVVQIGVPADREQYIHRLGRTGRKGKEGQGILLLAPWEEFFFSSIKDLPITQAPMPLLDPDTKKKVEQALGHVEMKNKESAYQAWLGYYNSNKNIGRDKGKLVSLANEFSRSMGLDNPPAIAKLVLGKMGLKNVPGLRSK